MSNGSLINSPVVINCSSYETEFPQAAIEFVLLLLLAASISGYSLIQYRRRGTTDALKVTYVTILVISS